jgi:hypothetical protein
MASQRQTDVSPYIVIGLVFVMNGIVMSMTLGFALGISFLTTGIVFLIIGLTSKDGKSDVPESGTPDAAETPRPE